MKNKILRLMIVGQLALCAGVDAQSVAINATGAVANSSAILDISSDTKGLLIPRIASTSSISSPANGLMVYSGNAININTGSTTVPTFVPLLSSITVTAPLTYTTGSLAIPVATTNANGYLASIDWTTFNNKQALINNLSGSIGFVKANGTTITFDPSVYVISISGTANYLPKFAAGGATFSNSLVYDNSTTTSTVGIATAGAATSTLQVNGSFATPVISIGSATAASSIVWSTASLVLVTFSTTITLPTAVGISGRIYTIKSAASGITFNVASTSSQTIDGATPYTGISAGYKFVTVQSDNSNWNIIGNN